MIHITFRARWNALTGVKPQRLSPSPPPPPPPPSASAQCDRWSSGRRHTLYGTPSLKAQPFCSRSSPHHVCAIVPVCLLPDFVFTSLYRRMASNLHTCNCGHIAMVKTLCNTGCDCNHSQARLCEIRSSAFTIFSKLGLPFAPMAADEVKRRQNARKV